MTTTHKERCQVIINLNRLNIGYDDAQALRRISMTLQRWHELECGTAGSSISVERDDNGEGKPRMRIAYHNLQGKYVERFTPCPDREKGALRRLAALIGRYPELTYYVQTDPRGAALHILRKADVNGCEIDQVYNRGVVVF